MTYDEAKAALSEVIHEDGKSLFSLGWYLAWDHGYASATLDGDFTADDLFAIATYMKGPPA